MIKLFPDNPKFTASNWTPIDRDATMWDPEITSKIKKIIPDDTVDVSIIWNSKNEEKGYGVGSIIIINKNNKNKFLIPIIIKEFKIAPLDIMITPHGASRLTEEKIEEVMFSGQLGIGTSPRKSGLMGHQDTDFDPDHYVPHDVSDFERQQVIYQKESSVNMMEAWLYGNKDAFINTDPIHEDAFSFLVEIEDTIDKSASVRAKNALRNASVLHKYANEKSIFVDFINGLDPNVIEYDEFNNVKDEKHGKRIEVIKKHGPNAYVMLSNSLANFEPSMNITSGGDVRMVLKENFGDDTVVDSIMNAVETVGERGAIMPWAKKDISNTLIYTDAPSPGGSTYGIYDAYNPKGQVSRGILYRTVVDLDGESHKVKMFVTKEGGGLQATGFSGSKVDSVKPSVYNEEFVNIADRPSAGDYGCFVCGQAVIGPVFVQSVSTTMSDDEYTVHDGRKNLIKVRPAGYIDGFIRHENSFSIGKKFKWMNIPRQIKYKRKHAMVKEASVSYSRNGYDLGGFDVEHKWAVALPEAEAKFVLSSHGLGINKIAKVLNMAKENGIVKISGLPGVATFDKQAAQNNRIEAWDTLDFNPAKFDFVKLASSFNRIDTVDRVLGLNFINDSNIARFTSALPLLQETEEELVRLLVVSRIGASEVPEGAVVQTLDSMSEIIEGLRRLKLRSK